MSRKKALTSNTAALRLKVSALVAVFFNSNPLSSALCISQRSRSTKAVNIKKVFISGGCGFVGSYLSREAAQAGLRG